MHTFAQIHANTHAHSIHIARIAMMVTIIREFSCVHDQGTISASITVLDGLNSTRLSSNWLPEQGWSCCSSWCSLWDITTCWHRRMSVWGSASLLRDEFKDEHRCKPVPSLQHNENGRWAGLRTLRFDTMGELVLLEELITGQKTNKNKAKPKIRKR